MLQIVCFAKDLYEPVPTTNCVCVPFSCTYVQPFSQIFDLCGTKVLGECCAAITRGRKLPSVTHVASPSGKKVSAIPKVSPVVHRSKQDNGKEILIKIVFVNRES